MMQENAMSGNRHRLRGCWACASGPATGGGAGGRGLVVFGRDGSTCRCSIRCFTLTGKVWESRDHLRRLLSARGGPQSVKLVGRRDCGRAVGFTAGFAGLIGCFLLRRRLCKSRARGMRRSIWPTPALVAAVRGAWWIRGVRRRGRSWHFRSPRSWGRGSIDG